MSDIIALNEDKPVCGIIRPIAGSKEPYTREHWDDVDVIISTVIKEIGYSPNLVSRAEYVNVIHERIVTNLYENPIVICDVSSRNPNVMFELGMRLAFDMPTIIIIDDKTDYNFDISPIEHLKYPVSLHYQTILSFQAELKDKLLGTIQNSKRKNFTTFLGNFKLTKREITTEKVNNEEYIVRQLNSIMLTLNKMEGNIHNSPNSWSTLYCKISVLYDEVAPELIELNKTLSEEAILAGGSLINPAGIDPNGNVMFTLRLPEQNVEAFKSNGKVSFRILREDEEERSAT